jgi:hypothetical protein
MSSAQTIPHDDPDESWEAWLALRLAAASLLREWIEAKSSGSSWYADTTAQLAGAHGDQEAAAILFKALGWAPRKLGKGDLALEPHELARADNLRPGFDPRRWSIDQTARIGLILAAAGRLDGIGALAALLDQLAAQGEVQELIALYQGFALYPFHAAISARAREAARSGMRPVFAAIALRNPWPRRMFDEAAWNQMILKTFFLDLPVWPIQGAAARCNPDLTRMLLDLADERQAAGRTVNPELWAMVACCPGERGLRRLARLAQEFPDAIHLVESARREHGMADEARWQELSQWQE